MRHDLPRQTILVFEPATLDFLSPFGKLLPEVIDLVLRLAMDHQRNRFREFERWTTIHAGEALAVQLEFDRHHRTLRTWSRFAVSRGAEDSGVLKHGDVEVRCLFSVVVKPQKRRDLLWLGLRAGRIRC